MHVPGSHLGAQELKRRAAACPPPSSARSFHPPCIPPLTQAGDTHPAPGRSFGLRCWGLCPGWCWRIRGGGGCVAAARAGLPWRVTRELQPDLEGSRSFINFQLSWSRCGSLLSLEQSCSAHPTAPALDPDGRSSAPACRGNSLGVCSIPRNSSPISFPIIPLIHA